MRQVFLSALFLSFLAACATPLQQCQAPLAREIAEVDELIIETRENIARGYMLKPAGAQFGVRVCTPTAGPLNFCARSDSPASYQKVAIDPKAEKRKLAGLEARRANLQRSHAECAATYPAL